MTLMRLARQRRDAVSRSVFSESVHPLREAGRSPKTSLEKPHHVSGVASCAVARGEQANYALRRKDEASATEVVKGETSTRLVLHPCPKYIYGEVRALVTERSQRHQDGPKAKGPVELDAYPYDSERESKDFEEDVGWPHILLTPSSEGVSFARQILVERAIVGVPSRRNGKRSVQPKPSPLRASFTVERSCPHLEMSCPGGIDSLSSPSPPSVETLVDMEGQWMFLAKTLEFINYGDDGLLSPNFAKRNVSCIFDEDDSELPSNLEDLPEIEDDWDSERDNYIMNENRPVQLERRVTFAELPSTRRDRPARRRPVKISARLNRVAIAGLMRFRSLGLLSFGRKA